MEPKRRERALVTTHSKPDNTHDDHCQNVRPSDFQPLSKLRPLVERAIAVGHAASLVLALVIAQYAAPIVTFLSTNCGCCVGIYRFVSAVEEPHPRLLMLGF